MTNGIIKAKLMAELSEVDDYTTYVFEILENKDVAIINSNYVMCVKYPNWNQSPIKIGEEGFLHFIEVIAGEDKWFDGTDSHYYKYSNWQFLKFIPIKTPIDKEILL